MTINNLMGTQFVIASYKIKDELFIHGGPDARIVAKGILRYMVQSTLTENPQADVSRLMEDAVALTPTLKYLSVDELHEITSRAADNDLDARVFEFMLEVLRGSVPTEDSFLGKVKVPTIP